MSVGRPRLEIGTHGKIRFEVRPNGKVTATTEFRGINGKNKKLSATAATQAAAERAVKLRAAQEGEFVAANGEITIHSTVADLIAFWAKGLDESHLREASINSYLCTANKHVVPYLQFLRISELSVNRLSKWLNGLVKSNGLGRAKDARLILNLALREAVYLEFIPSNPLDKVRPLPALPRNEVRALTMAQLVDVREALLEKKRREKGIGAPADDRLICYFEVTVSNGARIGEVLALTRSDVYLDEPKPFISINKTLTRDRKGKYFLGNAPKTASSKRLLPLSDEAVERLRFRISQLNDLSPNALIFPTRYGTVWQPQTLRDRLDRALEDAGLEHLEVHPHLFRKTVGTAVTDNLSIQSAAIILGHSDVRQTQKAYWRAPKPIDLDLGKALEIPNYKTIEVAPGKFTNGIFHESKVIEVSEPKEPKEPKEAIEAIEAIEVTEPKEAIEVKPTQDLSFDLDFYEQGFPSKKDGRAA